MAAYTGWVKIDLSLTQTIEYKYLAKITSVNFGGTRSKPMDEVY